MLALKLNNTVEVDTSEEGLTEVIAEEAVFEENAPNFSTDEVEKSLKLKMVLLSLQCQMSFAQTKATTKLLLMMRKTKLLKKTL